MVRQKKQGFLAMDEETRRKIAQKGGTAAHRKGKAHKLTYEERSKGGQKSKGNFKFRPEAAREAGRLGGQASARARAKKRQLATR